MSLETGRVMKGVEAGSEQGSDGRTGVDWLSDDSKAAVNCADESLLMLWTREVTALMLTAAIDSATGRSTSRTSVLEQLSDNRVRYSLSTQIMSRVVSQVATKYQVVLNKMLTLLDVPDVDSVVNAFCSIVNSVFKDGQYNWGRVALVLTFTGLLCKHCVDKRIITECDVNMLTCRLGQHIEHCLSTWVSQQDTSTLEVQLLDEQLLTSYNETQSTWTQVALRVVGLGAAAAAVVAAVAAVR